MLDYAHRPDRALLEESLAACAQLIERDPARIAAAYADTNLAFHALQLDRVIRIAALSHALGAPDHEVLAWLQNAAGLAGEAARRGFPCGPLDYAQGMALAVVTARHEVLQLFLEFPSDIWLGPDAPSAPAFVPFAMVLRQGAGGTPADAAVLAALAEAVPVRPYRHDDLLVPLALAAIGALSPDRALQRRIGLESTLAHHPVQRAATFMLLDLIGLALLAQARARGAAAPTGLPANLPASLLPEGQWDIR